MNTDINWQIGQSILNLYQVKEVLGEGGFGKVLRVLHQDWNKELAVKIPRQETIEALGGVEDFEKEAQTWVDMQLHPHIVSCYYVRNIEDKPTVFAEYIEEGSLHDWIYGKNGQSPKLYNPQLYDVADSPQLNEQPVHEIILERIIDIAIQFAWGLDYAHEKGLVHKDIKPSNVMLTPKGTVKITDFGLTESTQQLLSGSRDNLNTSAIVTGVAGTPAYFSPEQAKKADLDRRSDLFSWALSVLEMLKGERRWKYGNWATGDDLEYYLQLKARLPNHLQQLSTSNTAKKLFSLLRECCQENPNHRPENMMVIADRLEAIYKEIAGRKYLRKKPKLADLVADDCNNRALSNLELGEREKGIKLWQEALKAQPQHPETTYNYGLFRWRNAEINDDELVENLEGVISSNSDNWIPKYLLAQVHLERDDCDSAIRILEGIEGEDAEQRVVRELLEIAINQEKSPKFTKLLNILEAHSDAINSVCLSVDGKLAVSGSHDKSVKLWNVETGECRRIFEGHQEEVLCVYLSLDQKLILSGSSDKTLKIWDLETGKCIQTVYRFEGAVSSLYLSHDNQFLLTGENFAQDMISGGLVAGLFKGTKKLLKSDYNNLKLWRLETQECSLLKELEGHTMAVRSCCLDKDNQFILSGGGDRVLKLWEVQTGDLSQVFGELYKGADAVTGHKGSVISVAFTHDGILSGSEDSTLKLWNKDTGECLQTLEGHEDRVTSVAVTKDGKFALSSEESRKLKLWDLSTGQCLRTFEAHSNRVTSVSLSSDGHLAISGSFDRTIEVRQLGALTSKTHFVASFSPSRVLETENVLEEENIYKQELERAEEALKQNDYLMAKRHIGLARQQSGYNKREEGVKLWSNLYVHLPRGKFRGGWLTKTLNFLDLSKVGEYHFRKTPKLLGKLHSSVHLGEDNSFILIGRSRSNTFNLEVLDFPHFSLNKSLEGFEKKWKEALDSGDELKEKWLEKENPSVLEKIKYTTQQGFNTLKMLSTMTDRNVQWGSKTCLYLSADSKLAVSGHELGRLKLYNVETGKLIWTYRRHGIISHDLDKNIRPTIEYEEVNSVYISRDNRFILSGGADKTLKLWEIGNDDSPPAYTSLEKDYLRNFQGHQEGVLSVCLTLDNEFALSGSADKTLKLWQVSTGECLKTLEGHQDTVRTVCLSSNGKFALSGSTDMTIKYWDLETGECLKTFQGHTQAINSIFLSVDNKFLLSGSDDKTVRLWDVETGNCVEIFEGHRNKVTSVCLASNNEYAISADGEVIKIWFLDWELEERQPTNWDEGVRLYLDIFLKQHTPYAFSLPNHRKVTEEEITQSLTREGIPQWTEKDFQDLLYTLACAGYGWLNPDGVREQLQAVKKEYSIVITQNLINETIKRVNYSQLVNALAQEMWREANEETCNLIRLITNCKQGTNINIHYWRNLAKEHLLMIDLLWFYYSNGQFGFRLQKKAFEEVHFRSIKQWDKVGDRLGWRQNNKWLSDEEINFTTQAPEGHLPVLGTSLNLPLWWMRCGAYVNLMCSNAWKNLGSDDDYVNIDIDEILRQFITIHSPPQKSDRSEIKRYTRIEFPSECILEKEVNLLIQLVVQTPSQNRVLEKVSISTDIETEEIRLYVHITAPGFSIPQKYKSLLLPFNEDSEEIIFNLVPVDLGRQVVEIELFHECIRVGYALVETNVKDSVL